MTRNPEFTRVKEERNNESFFKMLQSIDVSSENMRALPHEFARSFSDKELSCKMKIRTQWGRSWEVAISKNPRFYFMEKSGWEKFLRDNALGRSEFLTFTHKGNLCFIVNIFKHDGKEMLQPSQSRASLASSGRIETDQRRGSVNNDVKKEEVVSPELSNRCPTRAAESNGGRKYKRKLSFGKKKAEESENSKRTKRRVSADAYSSSVAEFTVIIRKSYLNYLWIPSSVAKDHMPEKQTIFKIHHPNGRNTWNVVYLLGTSVFSGGWIH